MTEYIARVEGVEWGAFEVCYIDDDVYVKVTEGEIRDLGDIFKALAAMGRIKTMGKDTYILVNPDILPPEFEEESD